MGRAARLDDGFHTNQLRREDPWRYSVVEVLLKLQQLAHEVEVRRDDGPFAFHKLVGVGHGHPAVLHQVGDHDGGRSRHARLAVDQKAHSCLVCFLCRKEGEENLNMETQAVYSQRGSLVILLDNTLQLPLWLCVR